MRLHERVRLHILTGFLGSGKSTLLRRHLHDNRDASKVVVLINEFGAVAIDHTLVRAVSKHAGALAGGCACCTGDKALRTTLIEVLTQMERGELPGVRDIVLETSGIADPSRIIGTIAGEMHLAEYIQVANCVTTVEVGTDTAFVQRFPELQNQIGCASRIVLTKGDLQPKSAMASTVALLQAMNPLAEIVLSDQLGASGHGLFGPSAGPRQASPIETSHHSRFSTFQIEIDAGLEWPSFSVWLTALMHLYGDVILRFKGVVPLRSPKQALVLQSVRHRVSEPEHLDFAAEAAQTAYGLVFICAGDYEAPIRASLTKFRALSQRFRMADEIRHETYS